MASGMQPRKLQWYENPLGETPCRFDSGPRHHFIELLRLHLLRSAFPVLQSLRRSRAYRTRPTRRARYKGARLDARFVPFRTAAECRRVCAEPIVGSPGSRLDCRAYLARAPFVVDCYEPMAKAVPAHSIAHAVRFR